MDESASSKSEIRRIERQVADRICTAQVVTCVSSAIRQLIDNSIDARAATITVTLRNHGVESFEVADDGTGIDEANFDVLCKPHCTSKISNLSDFDALTTLGFRGEALNALCALSTVTIVTRSESAQFATKLTYDHEGNIVQRDTTARQKGTTVIVERLFETLPKEFNRVLSVLQCFALSATHIKFVCSHFLNSNRTQLICTQGGTASMDEVVSNLYGGRADKNKMMRIEKSDPDDEVCALYSLEGIDTEVYDGIELRGYVSSCEHGFGRSAADRQFIFFNNRPVDYPKICRTANEIYQTYNRHKYPTLVLFIQVPAATIDVNVTPDKRTVIYQHEKQLLCIIRASILATYKPILGNCTTVEPKKKKNVTFGEVEISVGRQENGSESGSEIGRQMQVPGASSSTPLPSITELLAQDAEQRKDRGGKKRRQQMEDCNLDLNGAAAKFPKINVSTKDSKNASKNVIDHYALKFIPHGKKEDSPKWSKRKSDSPTPSTSAAVTANADSVPDATLQLTPGKRVPLAATSKGNADADLQKAATVIKEEAANSQENTVIAKKIATEELRLDLATASVNDEFEEPSDSSDSTSTQSYPLLRAQQKLSFSISDLNDRLAELRNIEDKKNEYGKKTMEFQARVVETDSDEAEKELDMMLKKTDMAEMVVIGQFNKGFIVTQLGSHLFIVDQHASDEKFNFEEFQRKAIIHTQKLLLPQPLNMGSVQEALIKENVEIFNKNGFDFEFQESEHGISAFLVATPVLNSCQLDLTDIDEILASVKEYPGQMYRPAKLRRIFASKACRKATMVGDALNEKQMKTIVSNLSTLDHPWNCPHGRPTLRHLFDMMSADKEATDEE